MNHGKTKIVFVLLPAMILVIIALFFIRQRHQTAIVNIPQFNNQTHPSIKDTASTSPDSNFIIPNSLFLPVPFTPQAPTGNWDQLHNEACEEASAIMAAEYFSGNKNTQLDSKLVEGQLTRLTEWQDQNFGYHLDTTSAETARMIKEVYGLQTKLLNNFSAEDIKKELAQNHLVLISENGRLLGNPYYKQPGPIHHMLVIKGYDKNGNFITNDSGTKRGLNYLYDFDAIFNAAADWRHNALTTDTNIKIAIAVWK
jgi:hypothetical protein